VIHGQAYGVDRQGRIQFAPDDLGHRPPLAAMPMLSCPDLAAFKTEPLVTQ
jgi:hypothetical protein